MIYGKSVKLNGQRPFKYILLSFSHPEFATLTKKKLKYCDLFFGIDSRNKFFPK